MTDTPESDWLAAVRRCGGKPREGESQIEFAARVAEEFGVDKPRVTALDKPSEAG